MLVLRFILSRKLGNKMKLINHNKHFCYNCILLNKFVYSLLKELFLSIGSPESELFTYCLRLHVTLLQTAMQEVALILHLHSHFLTL